MNKSLYNAFWGAGHHVGSVGFICIALDRSRMRGEITTSECENAQKLVRDRLDGLYTLDTWCKKHIPGLQALWEEDPKAVIAMVQVFRIRWLNHLIKEFS